LAAAHPDPYGNRRPLKRELARWMGAASCVAAVHAGLALAAIYWPQPRIEAAELPAAVMIELSPLPVAPDTPPQEVAVGPESVMSEESTEGERSEKPFEKQEPNPETPREAPKDVTVEKTVTDTETPKLEEKPDAEAVLPVNASPPTETEKTEEIKPPPVEKKTEPNKSQVKAKKVAVTMAPKPVPAAKAKTNAAAASGVSSSMSLATWRGMVMAHLNRLKRIPGGAGGTSHVAFTIDRTGRVLSARLVRSSGNAALDGEAVALARRASPVPAPPASMIKGSITLTAPVYAR
jgi:protein TonB